MTLEDEGLKLEDFEQVIDINNMIVIPAKTDITIQCVHSEVKDMSPGRVLMREEQHLMFMEEECFLIPSGLFGKILSQIKASLIEKDATDDKKGRREPKAGDTSIH